MTTRRYGQGNDRHQTCIWFIGAICIKQITSGGGELLCAFIVSDDSEFFVLLIFFDIMAAVCACDPDPIILLFYRDEVVRGVSQNDNVISLTFVR